MKLIFFNINFSLSIAYFETSFNIALKNVDITKMPVDKIFLKECHLVGVKKSSIYNFTGISKVYLLF